jgi:hypothetical protein
VEEEDYRAGTATTDEDWRERKSQRAGGRCCDRTTVLLTWRLADERGAQQTRAGRMHACTRTLSAAAIQLAQAARICQPAWLALCMPLLCAPTAQAVAVSPRAANDDPRWLRKAERDDATPHLESSRLAAGPLSTLTGAADGFLSTTSAWQWNGTLHQLVVALLFRGITGCIANHSSSSSSSCPRRGRPRFRPAAGGAGASPAGTPLVTPATSRVRLIFCSTSSSSSP